jgi:hypothetical protein
MSSSTRGMWRLAQRAGAINLVALLALGGAIGPWSAAPAAALSGINIVLPAGHHITGHVYGPGHLPLAGVGVSAVGSDSNLASPSAVTAADGSYTLYGVPDDTYLVRFDPPDGSNELVHWYGAPGSSEDSSGATPVVVGGADVSGIDQTLDPGMTISGAVTGDGIDSVAGIQVNASGQAGGNVAIVAADGTFKVQGLNPGTYTLSTYRTPDSPYLMGTLQAGAIVDQSFGGTPIDVRSGNASGIDFSLVVGNTISGHISGGASSITVEASEIGGSFGSGSASVASPGDYAVRGLWPGTYRIVYVPTTDPRDDLDSPFPYGAYGNGQLVDQNSASPVDITSGSATLDPIVIPAGTSLGGTVGADGTPLSGAYVQVCDLPDGRGCATTTSAADGSYSIGHIETGSWTILAAAGHHVAGYFGPGGYSATSTGATSVPVVAGGPDVDGIDISLPDGGAVSGTVDGPESAPLAGIEMSPGGGSGQAYPGQAPCLSSSTGAYSCDGLEAGLYTLFAIPPTGSDELAGYYKAGAPGNYTWDAAQATSFQVSDTNDSAPPTITSRSPDRTVHGIARDTSISVGFSEDVKGVGSKTLQLEVDGTTGLVAGTYGYNAITHVATFKPSGLLAAGTRYRVIATSGLTDDAGNHLVRSSWTFTTTTDATAPTVVGKLPRAGSTNVPDGTAIHAQFSEQVRGLSSKTFFLVDRSNQQHIFSDISYDPATRTASFGGGVIDPGKSYLVVLEPGITDLAGNPLARVSWTFTTSNP